MIHGDEGVDVLAADDEVSADGSLSINSPLAQHGDRGRGDMVVVVAKQAVLASVRIDSKDADARVGDADVLQGAMGGLGRSHNQLRRQARQSSGEALMQRGVHNAQASAHKHHKHAVFRHVRQTRDEAGIARERNARRMNGRLIVWTADDGFRVALAHELHGAVQIIRHRLARVAVDVAGYERSLRQRGDCYI